MSDPERLKIVALANGKTCVLGYSRVPEGMSDSEFASRGRRVNAAIDRFSEEGVERLRLELVAALPGILAAEGLEFEALPEV
jgi:DNA integrity scanning protein DisA with diadenylate cyclase activity